MKSEITIYGQNKQLYLSKDDKVEHNLDIGVKVKFDITRRVATNHLGMTKLNFVDIRTEVKSDHNIGFFTWGLLLVVNALGTFAYLA